MTSSRSISGAVALAVEQGRALGEEDREQRRALLALGSVAAHGAAGDRDLDLVQVGAVRAEAPREVRGPALARARPRSRRRSAPVHLGR